MLTISTDPCPLSTIQGSDGSYDGSGGLQPQISSLENGVEPSVADKDEIMVEVQETEVNEDTRAEVETVEDTVRSSEASPTPMVDSQLITTEDVMKP